MYSVITVLIVIVCIFLILFVLVQNSKGGGLAANFSSSNQIMGVRKTADFLEKATWTLAGALAFFCIVGAIWLTSRSTDDGGTILQQKVENAVDPREVPSFPASSQPDQTTTPTEQPANQPTE